MPISDQQLHKSARKITATLLAVQSLGSAAIISGATIAAIVGAELSGRTELAGLPGSVSQLGVAASALFWSLMTDRLGRRKGLALGVITGAIGGLLALFAVLQGAFLLLLCGILVMSSANASFNLGRFTAAEVNPPAWRGRAVAFVVLGGTFGSVIGPTLVAVSGRIASHFGASPLAGPYGVDALFFAIAALVLLLLLRPEPKLLAQAIETRYPTEDKRQGKARPLAELLRHPGIFTAMTAMILSHAVMILLMGITSLHMHHHDHSLDAISLVFSAHTLGMFALSVVTGWLIDRWGRIPMILSGAIILVLSCILAPLSPQFFPIAMALFLLGLGWNFCYVAGSTLLADQLTPAEKARTQGVNDMLMGLVSASFSVLAGFMLARYGYGAISLAGLGVSSVLLGVALWYAVLPGRALLGEAP
jgi:MFS family permease